MFACMCDAVRSCLRSSYPVGKARWHTVVMASSFCWCLGEWMWDAHKICYSMVEASVWLTIVLLPWLSIEQLVASPTPERVVTAAPDRPIVHLSLWCEQAIRAVIQVGFQNRSPGSRSYVPVIIYSALWWYIVANARSWNSRYWTHNNRSSLLVKLLLVMWLAWAASIRQFRHFWCHISDVPFYGANRPFIVTQTGFLLYLTTMRHGSSGKEETDEQIVASSWMASIDRDD